MRSVFIAFGLVFSLSVTASGVSTNGVSVVSPEISQRAVDYGLQVTEVQKYEAIMKGPRGAFYRRGDSNVYYVLGAEAETEQERRRYAQLYLDQSYQYHNRLAMWVKTFDSVSKERFGNNPRIMDVHKANPLQSQLNKGGSEPLFRRLKMYIKIDDCQRCIDEVNTELSNVNSGIVGGIDLYFVDANQDDNRIRNWAKSLKLSPQLVASKVITLNHDDFQSASRDYPVKQGVLWQQ